MTAMRLLVIFVVATALIQTARGDMEPFTMQMADGRFLRLQQTSSKEIVNNEVVTTDTVNGKTVVKERKVTPMEVEKVTFELVVAPDRDGKGTVLWSRSDHRFPSGGPVGPRIYDVRMQGDTVFVLFAYQGQVQAQAIGITSKGEPKELWKVNCLPVSSLNPVESAYVLPTPDGAYGFFSIQGSASCLLYKLGKDGAKLVAKETSQGSGAGSWTIVVPTTK